MPRTAPSEAKLREIVAKIPTPFHLYDAAGIRANVDALQQAFAWNPGFKEYFAVKATPNAAILKLLKDQGCGVDCSSYTELLLSDAMGFKGHDIMFSSNVTSAQEYQLARKLGVLINLSGGIGIPYEPGQPNADLTAIGAQVEVAYQETIVAAGMDPVAVVTELGRYITGPNAWLVATALHHKDTHKQYVGLDASAVNLLRPAMYGAYHHITVAGKEDAPLDHVYDVTGSLCENNDKFAIDRPLPEIEIGDLVVLHDTGAHGHSMGYNYNGKLRSAEVLLEEDGSFRMIRRAETPRDYFATIAGFEVTEDLGKPELDPLLHDPVNNA